MESNKNFVLGVFNDEDVLLDGVQKIKGGGVNIHEVFTPFPVHGLDHVLGYKRSKLPIAAFLFGLTGTILAITMQVGMMTVDWPMIIGGKDYLPVPTFVPVTFELTVLLTAFGMVGTFLVVADLKPWAKPKIFDIRQTDDKHIVAIDLADNEKDKAELELILKNSGAEEVKDKKFD
ncbi:MAG: DUF3341 domain-containing protein [Bacteroidota bacterium]